MCAQTTARNGNVRGSAGAEVRRTLLPRSEAEHRPLRLCPRAACSTAAYEGVCIWPRLRISEVFVRSTRILWSTCSAQKQKARKHGLHQPIHPTRPRDLSPGMTLLQAQVGGMEASVTLEGLGITPCVPPLIWPFSQLLFLLRVWRRRWPRPGPSYVRSAGGARIMGRHRRCRSTSNSPQGSHTVSLGLCSVCHRLGGWGWGWGGRAGNIWKMGENIA